MTEQQKYMIDTDVLVEYLRGNQETVAYLESLERRPATSVICMAELIAGARDEDENDAIEQFLLAFDVLQVDMEIARIGGTYRKRYSKSHGTGLADALIAATAIISGLKLVTFNIKHFPMLDDVLEPYKRI
jgi:predicted nucleic acid-binding protein